MITNRVELLVSMIYSDPETLEAAFDSLVPKYHSELYVLYNILDNADVLNTCGVSIPCMPSDALEVELEIDDDECAIVEKVISNNEYEFQPFKHCASVKLSVSKQSHGIRLIFQ